MATTSHLNPKSTWISSISYTRTPDGSTYLALFLSDRDEALLYGPTVPSWLPGLLSAGLGGKSVGRAYNKLVKGKGKDSRGAVESLGGYQRVVGAEKVNELRQLLGAK